MRYLHSVAPHEKFFAQGTYLFSTAGQPIGIKESWSIHEVGQEGHFIRVDFDARELDGTSLLMEILRNPKRQIERFEGTRFTPSAEIRRFKSNFTIYEGFVEVSETINRTERHYREHPITAETIFYPPTWMIAGDVIQQIITQGGTSSDVFYPRFEQHDPLEHQTFSASLVEETEFSFGKKSVLTRQYRLNEQVFWIDGNGIPLKMIDEKNQIEVHLTRYSHRK